MAKTEKTTQNKEIEVKPICGLIMPISPIDGCSTEHWSEIQSILKEVAKSCGFEPNLVSDADDIGIIQKRIIQNIYSNDIVICDVSGKNPNVMFELGMRLAFDKATVIVKDDKTDYSFDTGVIEHLGYPRDLRFHKILEFKENLKKKLESTYKKSKEDPNYSTFLKNFGEYKIAHLQEKEITSDKYILNAIEEIKSEFRHFRHNQMSERNMMIHNSEMNSSRQRHMDLTVKKYLDEFIAKNNIKRFSHVADSLDEFYEYLEQQEDVREICGHKRNIRRTMDRVLNM
jgi:hypothetical protein